MDNQEQRKTQAAGHENHGVHLCHKCGWPFPNPHPSAKHRRAHKKICGTIEGYKLVKDDDDTSHVHLSNVEHHSDEDRREPSSPKGLESSSVTDKLSGGVGERLISGDEVFADAFAEFSDGGCNLGAKENVQDTNLSTVTVNDQSTRTSYKECLGGSAVPMVTQLKRKSSESGQIPDPETPGTSNILESNPVLHDDLSSQTIKSTVENRECRSEQTGVTLLDSKPDFPSDAFPKVNCSIDGLLEGDAGHGVTEPIFTLQKDDGDNMSLREAPITTLEETPQLNTDNVASPDTEPTGDFVLKVESRAEDLLEPGLNVQHPLDVGPLQHVSISANSSKVDLGLHALEEGQEKDGNACKTVPGDMSNLANPANLTEHSEVLEGVKLEIASTLPSQETIKNVKESSTIASDVSLGESYMAEDSARQQSVWDKLMVAEAPMEHLEPLVEDKPNLDERSDDGGASIVVVRLDMNGQTGGFSHRQESDYCCKDFAVNSPDCLATTSNVIPADVSVCSVNHGKDTSADDNHYGVTEGSDLDVRVNALQFYTIEPPIESDVPSKIVADEDDSNHNKFETETESESYDTIELHIREGSLESEGSLTETSQTTGFICNDDTHHAEEIKMDGISIDESGKLEAVTMRCDVETKSATLQPLETLPLSQEKSLTNKDESYGVGGSEGGEIKNIDIAEDQSLAGPLGKNTLPVESASNNETGDGSVKEAEGILSAPSPTFSGSEKETNEVESDVIETVPVECEFPANTAVGLQTDNVTHDKKMDESIGEDFYISFVETELDLQTDSFPSDKKISDPISKDSLSSPLDSDDSVKSAGDSQTKEFRAEDVELLTASSPGQGVNDLVKQKSGVSGIDGSVGICSRSDSLECNWGSVSVMSLQSEAQAGLDSQTIPSANPHASTEGISKLKTDATCDFQQSGESEMFDPPSLMTLVEPGHLEQKSGAASEGQTGPNSQHHPSSAPLQAGWFPSLTQEATNGSEASKKNEEIIAKVTNWSTGKQHGPLKSLLTEAAQDVNAKFPIVKENQKTEKALKDNGTKTTTTVNSILGPESPTDQVAAAKKEIAKEWNSPARYPSDLQREKRKVRGRPFWTQFVCCTSVNSR